jgi:uncharacterized protein YecT (DUF1311 family)
MRWALIFFVTLSASCAAAQSSACKLANTRGGYGDIAACNEERFRVADAKMNSLYDRLLKQLADQPDKRDQLSRSQRSWVAHRDATCMFWAGVVDYNIPVCRHQVTEQRNTILRRMHECLAEGGGKCS